MSEPTYEWLEWDSQFFGHRISRIHGQTLTEDRERLIRRQAQAEGVECLYLLASASDATTVAVAEAAGYRLTDIRMAYERLLPPGEPVSPTPRTVRLARSDDRAALGAIAARSHREARFYFDPRLARSRCDDFYRTWIERSLDGWADVVFVVESDGVPAGYVSCHLVEGAVNIGLLAVDEHARGDGLGRALVSAVVQHAHSVGASVASVVTQGRNVASQRLYQQAGFVVRTVHLWFHFWPGPPTLPSAGS